MDPSAHVFYVAPNGNDRWNGQSPEPDPQSGTGPFATLSRARDAVRALKDSGGLRGSVTVYLRGGIYPLRRPVEFGPGYSAPVTYAAYPGETPVLFGGERIEGWEVRKMNGQPVWVAYLPEVARGEWYFRSLFVNGARRERPRWPKEGFFQIENVPGKQVNAPLFDGSHVFQYAPGDIEPWENLTDIEVVVPHFWTSERMPIAQLDPSTRTVTCARRSVFALTDDFTRRWAYYYLENVFEKLSAGEWYLDRTRGLLYYAPLPGETLDGVEIVAPRTEQFLRLIGRPQENRFVEFLTFRGIHFVCGDWSLPRRGGEEFGHQVNPELDLGSAPQAACNVPGAIEMIGARYCTVDGCTIKNIGIYGIDIGPGCWANRVTHNEIAHMGAGGVKVNGADAHGSAALRTGRQVITDNYIHHGGRVFHAAVGIITRHAFGNEISHNHIHDLYYTGISCGWTWGYGDNVSKENRIEKNYIHDLGHGFLSDMGGIYTLGVQPGTVVRGNVIHDIRAKNYGGWAIYLDEGTSHVIVEQNICYRTSSQCFNTHYGRENTVRNNIFAFGRLAQVSLGRPESHLAFTLERNILLCDGQPAYACGGAGLASRGFFSDLNLVWDLSGPVRWSGPYHGGSGDTLSRKELAALGYDLHSIVADPLFVDPQAGNFALKPDSPAWSVGFQPIDTSDVGPRRRGS